ncbi:MAG: hypothetical protein AAFX99_11740 [Myxococcota bacterium]
MSTVKAKANQGRAQVGRLIGACGIALVWVGLGVSGAAAQQGGSVPQKANGKAQPAEGVVIQVEAGEIVVNLGREQGLVNGAQVWVYRRLEVKHPVTGQTIVDRFPAGSMRLKSVGKTLAVTPLKEQEELERLPKPGDVVVWAPFPDNPQQTDTGTRPFNIAGASGDPALEAVEAAFMASLGQPLDTRVAVWEAYIETHPDSPYIEQVGRELEWLRGQMAEARSALEQARAKAKRDSGLRARVIAPGRVTRGREPLWVVAAVDEPKRVERLRVLVRRPEDSGFAPVDMERMGDHAWSVELEQQPWLKGDHVDFFVEAVRTDGQLESLDGNNAGRPRRLTIEKPIQEEDGARNRSRARVMVEAVDFKSGQGEDNFLRFESDYRYTVDRWGVMAFTVGVGIFSGEGGTLAQVEQGDTRALNTNYGFAELELGLASYLGVSGRVLVGDQARQGEDGLSEAFGFRGQLRIGEFDGTRLELGAALTDGIGTEGWITLWLDIFESVPMAGEVVVTNLPVGEDLGVSLNYSVGYEVLEGFTPMIRLGWNARTINHTGFSGGLGAAYTW